MKLYKALKVKKNLVNKINKLKEQIKDKNSFLVGSMNGENFDVENAYKILLATIQELIGLKFVINEANLEIQARIYRLNEYKALISFWNEVSVVEGAHIVGYGDVLINAVQVDETKRDELVTQFQSRIDAIQDEIDEYIFNTEIPWGNMDDGEMETLEETVLIDDVNLPSEE